MLCRYCDVRLLLSSYIQVDLLMGSPLVQRNSNNLQHYSVGSGFHEIFIGCGWVTKFPLEWNANHLTRLLTWPGSRLRAWVDFHFLSGREDTNILVVRVQT